MRNSKHRGLKTIGIEAQQFRFARFNLTQTHPPGLGLTFQAAGFGGGCKAAEGTCSRSERSTVRQLLSSQTANGIATGSHEHSRQFGTTQGTSG